MDNLFFDNFLSGVGQFFSGCDWVFIVIFILWGYVTNKISESTTSFTWMNWFAKIPKGLRVFILGVLLAILYGYFTNKTGKEGVSSMFYSVTVGMVFYEIAMKKIFEWLEKKIQ